MVFEQDYGEGILKFFHSLNHEMCKLKDAAVRSSPLFVYLPVKCVYISKWR